MTPRLVAFIRLLRTQGLRLSVAESLDALHSVSLVGLHDRELLRLTLRTALVKSHQDFPTFDALFERFFTVPRRRRRGQLQSHPSTGLGQRAAPQQNGTTSPPAQRMPLTPAVSVHYPAQQPHTDSRETTSAETAQALQALAELEQAWQEHSAVLRSPRTSAPPEHADTQRA